MRPSGRGVAACGHGQVRRSPSAFSPDCDDDAHVAEPHGAGVSPKTRRRLLVFFFDLLKHGCQVTRHDKAADQAHDTYYQDARHGNVLKAPNAPSSAFSANGAWASQRLSALLADDFSHG